MKIEVKHICGHTRMAEVLDREPQALAAALGSERCFECQSEAARRGATGSRITGVRYG